MQLYRLKFPNGKSYIGITSKTAEERFKCHCLPSDRKYPCQFAIHKYGKENIILSVLAECDNWELLCLAEIEAIEKFNTFNPNGYNLTLGGEGRHIPCAQKTPKVIKQKALKQKTKRCRPDRKEYQKKYRETNTEKAKEYQKQYKIKNKLKLTDYQKAYQKEYQRASKVKKKEEKQSISR